MKFLLYTYKRLLWDTMSMFTLAEICSRCPVLSLTRQPISIIRARWPAAMRMLIENVADYVTLSSRVSYLLKHREQRWKERRKLWFQVHYSCRLHYPNCKPNRNILKMIIMTRPKPFLMKSKIIRDGESNPWMDFSSSFVLVWFGGLLTWFRFRMVSYYIIVTKFKLFRFQNSKCGGIRSAWINHQHIQVLSKRKKIYFSEQGNIIKISRERSWLPELSYCQITVKYLTFCI